jgi:hypothetical protein
MNVVVQTAAAAEDCRMTLLYKHFEHVTWILPVM